MVIQTECRRDNKRIAVKEGIFKDFDDFKKFFQLFTDFAAISKWFL
jgi:hypothetical protein